MFYSDYIFQRSARERISKKLEQNKNKQNASIIVRDLVVFPNTQAFYGESKAHFNQYDSIEMVPRLIDHIKSLTQIANAYHEQAYCELGAKGKYQLQKQHENTITRLSLSEFSLYGEKPLSMSEFALVINAIEDLAKRMHNNVHVLLSSFAVLNEKGDILNISLYVQGGERVRIDTVSKGMASAVDVRYKGTANFSQQVSDGLIPTLSAYIAGDKAEDSLIPNNSLLEIETQGGARYLQAIDVCLDHANEHSKRLLLKKLKMNGINCSHFVPEQVDHIVTSNSIFVEENAKISPSVLHVDPSPSLYFDRDNRRRKKDKAQILSTSSLASITQYPKMEVDSQPGKLWVSNPPFGSDYYVTVYEERRLSGFKSRFNPLVKEANKGIMKAQVDRAVSTNLSQTNSVTEFADLMQTGLDARKAVAQLLEDLTEQCKPTFFEFIFGIGNYYLKKQAQMIIADSAYTLGQVNDDVDMLSMSTVWARDLRLKLDVLCGYLPNSFIYELTHSLDVFQQHNETICPLDVHSCK